MKDLADTVEFFAPPPGARLTDYISAMPPDIGAIHHLARYEWAARVLADRLPRRVLDIACGSGYGAAGYSAVCPASEIVGSDYDPRGVSYAAARHSAPNLRFTQGDMVTWQSAKGGNLGVFDVITTFDTIEHVAHRDLALLNLARHLPDDGVLLLSTPCSHEQTDLTPTWHHHKVEYSYRDLIPLMRRFFLDVRQVSDAGFPHAKFWRDEVNGAKPLYPNLGNPLFCTQPIRERAEVCA